MSRPSAIAFDAFGTLCDLAERRSPYRHMADALGIPLRALWRRALTRPDALDGLTVVDQGALEAALEGLRAECDSFFVYADVPSVLAGLRHRRIPVAVVSNVATPYAKLLHRAFDEHADHLVLSCEVGLEKPSPEIFSLTAARLDRAPREILMVGDSPISDIAGAQAAGMAALRICRTLSPPEGALTNLEPILACLWS